MTQLDKQSSIKQVQVSRSPILDQMRKQLNAGLTNPTLTSSPVIKEIKAAK